MAATTSPGLPPESGAALRLVARRLAGWAPELLGLAACWALESWLLAIWLWVDTRPARWDESLLLRMTGHWRAFFAQPSLDALLSAATFSSGKTTPLWLALM